MANLASERFLTCVNPFVHPQDSLQFERLLADTAAECLLSRVLSFFVTGDVGSVIAGVRTEAAMVLVPLLLACFLLPFTKPVFTREVLAPAWLAFDVPVAEDLCAISGFQGGPCRVDPPD